MNAFMGTEPAGAVEIVLVIANGDEGPLAMIEADHAFGFGVVGSAGVDPVDRPSLPRQSGGVSLTEQPVLALILAASRTARVRSPSRAVTGDSAPLRTARAKAA